MNKICLLLVVSMVMEFYSCSNQEKKAGPAIGSFSSATSNADSANWTTVQWTDSVVNKGSITEGEKLEILFHFRNTGDKPLIIKDARPSCGCTVAEKPLEPIAPGKEGFIRAEFDSQNKPGPNHKTIMVNTNTRRGTDQLVFNVVVNKKS
jgi:hypothetical protein